MKIGGLIRGLRAGQDKLAWHRPDLSAPQTVELTSPDFSDGEPLPARLANEGISPALQWTGVPAGAAELVVIVEDPDVPMPRPVVHAVARIAPSVTALAEGALNRGAEYGSGRASLRQTGYVAPRPIPGHGPHAYVFQIFALDAPLPVDRRAAPKAVLAAMAGHVLARGRIVATCER